MARKSRLLKYPAFKPLPPFTEAANVEENIAHWLNQKEGPIKHKQDCIKNYLIEDASRKLGYRFITADDLTEEILTVQTLSKKQITVIFKRRYHWTDSFCPLHFSEWYTLITLRINREEIEYTTDAALKRLLRTI
jgi:hypothetical protein